MSEADMQLVRTTDGHNLAVGEPYFLREALGIAHVMSEKDIVWSLSYPPFKGTSELLKELAWMYPGKHVVITNGAKQGLLAACRALRLKRQSGGQPYGTLTLRHQPPYWPTYPTIAELSGMAFEAKPDLLARLRHEVTVLTAPNNPDGRMGYEDSSREWDIWDAVYANFVYGWDGIVPPAKISVWSGAKLFGLSGLRVGWLVTGDKELADHASTYVEQTTSGVGSVNQAWMTFVLRWWREKSPQSRRDIEKVARNTLWANAGKLERTMGPYFSKMLGFPSNGQGMFAWVKAKNPDRFVALLKSANVKVVSGQYCGADPEEGWFRISLGLSEAKMDEAMEAFSAKEQ